MPDLHKRFLKNLGPCRPGTVCAPGHPPLGRPRSHMIDGGRDARPAGVPHRDNSISRGARIVVGAPARPLLRARQRPRASPGPGSRRSLRLPGSAKVPPLGTGCHRPRPLLSGLDGRQPPARPESGEWRRSRQRSSLAASRHAMTSLWKSRSAWRQGAAKNMR